MFYTDFDSLPNNRKIFEHTQCQNNQSYIHAIVTFKNTHTIHPSIHLAFVCYSCNNIKHYNNNNNKNKNKNKTVKQHAIETVY